MMAIPPFVTCEEMFPRWMTARILIAAAIMPRFDFDFVNHGLQFDWEWLHRIVDLTPPEDKESMLRIFPTLERCAAIYLSAFDFGQFLGLPVTRLTLARCNSYIAAEEQKRICLDTFTLHDLVRHVLGIAPISPYKLIAGDTCEGEAAA